jgi:site-specific DNA-cytosine methylase
VRTHVDLCSGIGGFALGFIAAKLSEPVLFCDFDEKVRKLLKVRFPGIPIANDVKEIASEPKRFIRQRPFILSSGYPCQPFSASGKRAGEEDPRHIFPHIAEIVAQTRPSYCVFENVYGHISLGLDKVLSQMGSLDYTTATFIVPAAGFRPHKRDRLWIICKNMANTDNEGIWSCERRSDVDNEGSSGERGANRGASSSHDEWHDTQTTKDERMVVANTNSRRSFEEHSSTINRENERLRSKHESSGSRTTDVSDTNSNGSSATKERGSSEETIHEEQTRQIGTLDIEGASCLSETTKDVANSKSINRDEHELVREHGEAKTQEVPGNRDGLRDTQGKTVVNSKRKSGETQLQWEQRVLREQNREGQTDGFSGGDLSERGIRQTFSEFRRIFDGISGWLDEPRHLERTTHKNEYRAERLKQLGNALLPQITYRIGLAIKEIEDKK